MSFVYFIHVRVALSHTEIHRHCSEKKSKHWNMNATKKYSYPAAFNRRDASATARPKRARRNVKSQLEEGIELLKSTLTVYLPTLCLKTRCLSSLKFLDCCSKFSVNETRGPRRGPAGLSLPLRFCPNSSHL